MTACFDKVRLYSKKIQCFFVDISILTENCVSYFAKDMSCGYELAIIREKRHHNFVWFCFQTKQLEPGCSVDNVINLFRL